MSNTTSSTPSQPDNGKTIAILSYITWIGWIIALVMHSGNKTQIGAYHLRQTLGFWIFGIIVGFVVSIVFTILAFIPVVGLVLDVLLSLALSAFMIYLWVMGLLAAIKAEAKPMPIIGEKIQSLLKSVFA